MLENPGAWFASFHDILNFRKIRDEKKKQLGYFLPAEKSGKIASKQAKNETS